MIAEELCKRIKEKLEFEIAILPSIKKSPMRATRKSPGSAHLPPVKFQELVFQAAEQSDAEVLIILAGHWGSLLKASLLLIAERIQEELGKDVYILNYLKAVPRKVLESRYPEIEHAGEIETSQMLALYPEKVSEVYKELKPNYPERSPKFIFACSRRDYPRNVEYWGEPAKASKQKGELIIKKVVESLSRTIEEIVKRR
jgi:creatinine amidohydrolase/Fe(II)-dependent formamide hydrolase-like protein